jgi:hypothetical protein
MNARDWTIMVTILRAPKGADTSRLEKELSKKPTKKQWAAAKKAVRECVRPL